MDSEARKAKNEALFREINEGIADLVEHSPTVRSSPVAFVCECVDQECKQAVELTLDEYERVRSEPTHFLVALGHVAHDIEQIVSRNQRYLVVEKEGLAGAIAEATDPNG
jgi:hypothetical protein